MNFFATAAALILGLQLTFAVTPPPSGVPFVSWHREGIGTTTYEWLSVERRPVLPQAPQRIVNDSLGVALTSDAALVVDTASGAVLWEKNPDERRPIASITKLMTALVALDTLHDLSVPIEITTEDYTSLGFNNFTVGETFPASDVLAAAVVASDNTAMRAFARATGLSADDFLERMNERAKKLGLTATRFADTTGLLNENVSTARGVLAIAREAFANPQIGKLAKLAVYTATSSEGKNRIIRTTDKLIGSGLLTVVAGKTGYVTESGYNIVAEVRNRDGHMLRAVVLGSATNDDRFQDLKMLALWAWRNYRWPQG